MKRVRFHCILLVAILVIGSMPSSHAGLLHDEQWRPASVDIYSKNDFHKNVQIVDLPYAIQTFSYLWAENADFEKRSYRYVCTNTVSENCASPGKYTFQSILGVCKSASEPNCIEAIEVRNENGVISKAKFLEYNLAEGQHPNSFSAESKYNIPRASNPSIWSLSTAAHSGGNLYLANVSISGTRGANPFRPETGGKISAFISPVSIRENILNELGQCRQAPKTELFGTEANSSCTGSDFSYRNETDPRCVASYGADGACLTAVAFPEKMSFTLKLRLASEPNGWFHGRIADPKISIQKVKKFTSLTITANPVQVPILYQAGWWSELGAATRSWWKNSFARCNGNRECGPAGGSNPADPTKDIETTSTGLFQYPYGNFAMNIITSLAGDLNDKAVAAPKVWSFRTLEMGSEKMNSCLAPGSGLKGIVSTNSTTYSEGAPEFSKGNLNYRVASLHYLPDGSEFKGSYDLIMRSSVARCLYSFSQAPISGKIEIVSENGTPQIATTSLAEKNGWLYLSAKNFTFSSPTIKVKLNQSKKK